VPGNRPKINDGWAGSKIGIGLLSSINQTVETRPICQGFPRFLNQNFEKSRSTASKSLKNSDLTVKK
jgi:hypothetical protein